MIDVEWQRMLQTTCYGHIDEVMIVSTKQKAVQKTMYASSQLHIQSLKNEAQLLAKCNSPYVPKLIDLHVEENQTTLTITYVGQKSIDQARKKWSYLMQVLTQIQHIHQLGYLYIDHKPAHWRVDQHHSYLIDFNACIPLHQTKVHLSSQRVKQVSQKEDLRLFIHAFRSIYRRLWLVGHPKSVFSLRWRLWCLRLCPCLFLSILFWFGQPSHLYRIWPSYDHLMATWHQAIQHKSERQVWFEWVQHHFIHPASLQDKRTVLFCFRHIQKYDDQEGLIWLEAHISPTTYAYQLALCHPDSSRYLSRALKQSLSESQLTKIYELAVQYDVLVHPGPIPVRPRGRLAYARYTIVHYLKTQQWLALPSQPIQSEAYQSILALRKELT